MTRFIGGIVGVVLICFSAIGCTSSVTIPKWQEGVERYVREDGRGDPNVLRNVTVETGRPGFGMIADSNPAKSTDAKGVLLGHKLVNDRPWFIYLVGLVNKQNVSELRLAALNVRSGQYRWVLGKNDGNALKSYRNYNESLGRQRSGQSKAPITYHGFPQEADAFDLTVEQNRVSAVHQGSGARWDLTIPAAAAMPRGG